MIVGTEKVAATITSDTEISFIFPSIPAGTYSALVEVVGKGYAGIFTANVIFWVGSIAPIFGSKGGEDIIINGNGFDMSLPIIAVVGTTECKITNITPKQIACRTPSLTTFAGFNVKVT